MHNCEGKKRTRFPARDLLIGGVDEAGRGSLVGPLIVAGISVRVSQLDDLRKIGIKDSKLLTSLRRRRMFSSMMDCVESVCICKLSPSDVDFGVLFSSLNVLEAQAMAAIIEDIIPHIAYIDSCDVNPKRYGESVAGYLSTNRPRKIISSHHAEATSLAVAGASIVAKVTRDCEITRIREQYGEIGSGYPSDRKTIEFIKNWMDENKIAPPFVRKSWKPMKALLNREQCIILDQFVL
ncbi:MAG: ribonuclease HII [Thermoproteota archaeon]|nr:ribonuclease HII [Thermoproteota archaeon]